MYRNKLVTKLLKGTSQ